MRLSPRDDALSAIRIGPTQRWVPRWVLATSTSAEVRPENERDEGARSLPTHVQSAVVVTVTRFSERELTETTFQLILTLE